jgi:hypothetical protein
MLIKKNKKKIYLLVLNYIFKKKYPKKSYIRAVKNLISVFLLASSFRKSFSALSHEMIQRKNNK